MIKIMIVFNQKLSLDQIVVIISDLVKVNSFKSMFAISSRTIEQSVMTDRRGYQSDKQHLTLTVSCFSHITWLAYRGGEYGRILFDWVHDYHYEYEIQVFAKLLDFATWKRLKRSDSIYVVCLWKWVRIVWWNI